MRLKILLPLFIGLLFLIVIGEVIYLFFWKVESPPTPIKTSVKTLNKFSEANYQKVSYIAEENDPKVQEMMKRTASFYTHDFGRLIKHNVLTSALTTMIYESEIKKIDWKGGTYDMGKYGSWKYKVEVQLKVGEDDSYSFYFDEKDYTDFIKAYEIQDAKAVPIDLSQIKENDRVRIEVIRDPWGEPTTAMKSFSITKLPKSSL